MADGLLFTAPLPGRDAAPAAARRRPATAARAETRSQGPSPRALRQGWRYRSCVLSRCLAALVGGYALPALFAFASARWLPLPRVDALMPGTLVAFALMPAVVIGVFLARTATRAWGGLLGIAALLLLAGWWAGMPA